MKTVFALALAFILLTGCVSTPPDWAKDIWKRHDDSTGSAE